MDGCGGGGWRRGVRTQDALHGAGQHRAGSAARGQDGDAADADGDAQREVAGVRAREPDHLEHAVQQPDEALVPPARAPPYDVSAHAWRGTCRHLPSHQAGPHDRLWVYSGYPGRQQPSAACTAGSTQLLTINKLG